MIYVYISTPNPPPTTPINVESVKGSVADPDPHQSGKLGPDPDPHQSDKQDSDSHQSEKVESLRKSF
jgi:hypothetical protein